MKAQDFCMAALRMSGVKWRHQGRLPPFALDCIGLPVLAARACGVELEPEPPRYGVHRKGTEIRDSLAQVAVPVQWPPQAGDLLALDPDLDGEPHHLGIALAQDRLLHTSIHTRRVTEEPIDAGWRRRIHSIWRLNAMEDA